MKIRIKLLSDLCTASGETHNSFIDCDVTYDNYGIPYIPAKRLRGCIREAALELVELGLAEQSSYQELFGMEQSKSAKFCLSNALLCDYEQITADLKAYRNYMFANPQNVLDLYTDIRAQTALNMETGVAEKNSLRTTRVIRKGLVFEAKCELAVGADQKLLENAVSLVKHIGLSRTRGLGLVEMRLEDEKFSTQERVRVDKSMLRDKNRLRYVISLNSPMICKSEVGNQAVTQDFIPGGKVLGLLAGALGRKEYMEMMQHEGIVVSNAYIMHENERCIPCRISLQKEKDQVRDVDGSMKVLDMIYTPNVTNKQMTPVGITYISKSHSAVDVVTEISYHHQRPVDKSIGRATGNDDGSSFYQLAAISAGQKFCGYIYANQSDSKSVMSAIDKLGKIRMGYGKSSEFGDVEFVIDAIEIELEEKHIDIVHDQVLTLVSDLVLYNENGMPTTELSALKSYLEDILHITDLEIQNPFLRFSTVGGYNVTWHARKPIFQVLAKGSVMRIHSKDGFDPGLLANTFIGERTSEGYGEIRVEALADSAEVSITGEDDAIQDNRTNIECRSDVIAQLLDKEYDRQLRSIVREKMMYRTPDFLSVNNEMLNACVAKIRLLLKSEKRYEDLQTQVYEIADKNKRELCREMISYIKPTEIWQLANERLKLIGNHTLPYTPAWSEEQIYQIIYHYYMIELKYRNKSLRGGLI